MNVKNTSSSLCSVCLTFDSVFLKALICNDFVTTDSVTVVVTMSKTVLGMTNLEAFNWDLSPATDLSLPERSVPPLTSKV